jgi:hypothetical protein
MAVPDHAEANRRFVADPPTPDRRDPVDTMPAGSFESSNVHSALYDFGERTLFVRYLRDGTDAIYQYWDVPADTWNSLLLAGSKGTFINSSVAFDFQYAKFGRDEFPDRHVLDSDMWRRFLYDP